MIKFLVTWCPYSYSVNVKLLHVRETAKSYMVDNRWGKRRYKKEPGQFDYEKWFEYPEDALLFAREKHNIVIDRLDSEKAKVLEHAANNYGLKSATVISINETSLDVKKG